MRKLFKSYPLSNKGVATMETEDRTQNTKNGVDEH